MDFELTEDQKMLAKTVSDFAKNESPVARFRKLRDGGEGFEQGAWRKMGELGWLSVPFPEAIGGFGGKFIDCALILEQLGTTLVPEPYLSSVVLGGLTILNAGNAEQHARYLAPMMAGDTTLALGALEANSRYDVSSSATVAKTDGSGYKLTGQKTWVLGGDRADHFVVSANAGAGLSLFVVDKGAAGVTVTPSKTIDGRSAATLRLDDVAVDAGARLGDEGSAVSTLELAMDYGAAAAVAESVGVAQAMLQMTVEYLGTREQFGVKIGSFQALQHRAVDMYAEVELLRSISMASMVQADAKSEAERRADVSAAKFQLATGGIWVAQQAIQLHGGVGVTDEHDIGLYFKRMYALNALFGDEEHHVRRFANAPSFAETAVQ